MKSEANTLPAERYLWATEIFDDRAMAFLRKSVIRFMEGRKKDRAYNEYMQWTRSENEIALYTLYAYAEIPLPKTFDTLFLLSEPTISVATRFTITHAIFNGWTAVDEIAQGHKHIVVLRFDEAIPPILRSLPHSQAGKLSKQSQELGLCQAADFPFIQRHLQIRQAAETILLPAEVKQWQDKIASELRAGSASFDQLYEILVAMRNQDVPATVAYALLAALRSDTTVTTDEPREVLLLDLMDVVSGYCAPDRRIWK